MDSAFPNGSLRPGERVLWRGSPARGIRFGARDLFLVPFSLLWCGFAITAEVATIRSDGDPLFLLFGAVFVAIGLTIAAGRFGVDALLRARTRYALTDRRILIERAAPFGAFHSLDLTTLGDLKLVPGGRDTGSILFGPQPSIFGFGNGFDVWIPSLGPTPQFTAIDGARGVFDRIMGERERLAGR